MIRRQMGKKRTSRKDWRGRGDCPSARFPVQTRRRPRGCSARACPADAVRIGAEVESPQALGRSALLEEAPMFTQTLVSVISRTRRTQQSLEHAYAPLQGLKLRIVAIAPERRI